MEYQTEQHKKEGFHDFRSSQSISVVQAWHLETPRCMLEGCVALAFILQQTGYGEGRWEVGITFTGSLLLTLFY